MKTSVIIINFNSTEHTIKCIESIREKTKTTVEIIVVDNNSQEADRNELESWYNKNNKNIMYIPSRINTGFALGNMLGANFATGEYLFFLNNDCLLLNNAIDNLVSFMDNHPDVGLAGPKLFDRQKKYSPSFNYTPTVANKWLGSSICRIFKKNAYPSRKKEYSSPLPVQMISGSAMFFRKSCFNKLGGLDTNFFLYCEEEDVSIRAKRNGFNIYHVPSSSIVHFCGMSTERDLIIEKEFYISLFYMLEKNYSLPSRTLIKLRYIIKELKNTIKNKKRLSVFLFLMTGPSLAKSMRHSMKHR